MAKNRDFLNSITYLSSVTPGVDKVFLGAVTIARQHLARGDAPPAPDLLREAYNAPTHNDAMPFFIFYFLLTRPGITDAQVIALAQAECARRFPPEEEAAVEVPPASVEKTLEQPPGDEAAPESPLPVGEGEISPAPPLADTKGKIYAGSTPRITFIVNHEVQGYTATVKMRRPDQSITTKPATIGNAVEGHISCDLDVGDLPVPGFYAFQPWLENAAAGKVFPGETRRIRVWGELE